MLGWEPASATFQGRVVPRYSIYICCHHNPTSDEDDEGQEDDDENGDDGGHGCGRGHDDDVNISFLRPTQTYYKYYHSIAMFPSVDEF